MARTLRKPSTFLSKVYIEKIVKEVTGIERLGEKMTSYDVSYIPEDSIKYAVDFIIRNDLVGIFERDASEAISKGILNVEGTYGLPEREGSEIKFPPSLGFRLFVSNKNDNCNLGGVLMHKTHPRGFISISDVLYFKEIPTNLLSV